MREGSAKAADADADDREEEVLETKRFLANFRGGKRRRTPLLFPPRWLSSAPAPVHVPYISTMEGLFQKLC